ncbi:MAG TPA: hypothetical protein PKV29_08535, partial [Trichococcus flocculiformis]|nr:hypothetical protein [Trichococcus flocculiformis]
ALELVDQVLKHTPKSFAALRLKSKVYLQQEEELDTILASIEESEKYGYDDAIEYDRVYAYYIHGRFDECRRIHKELERTRPLSHST